MRFDTIEQDLRKFVEIQQGLVRLFGKSTITQQQHLGQQKGNVEGCASQKLCSLKDSVLSYRM